MAVFPDRIVLKNSTDSQAAIETAIQAGGTDEITQGEIVLGINPTSVQLYAKAGNGSIVTLSGVSGGIFGDLADVDLSTPATDGQVIAYNATSGNWEPVTPSVAGVTSIIAGPNISIDQATGDVTITATSGSGTAGSGTAGRGDGGNFDDGSVDASFAFGVYGGGDFSSGTDDIPIELLGGDEGPDGGSF